MKLVTGTSKNGEMELPAVDSCGLSEGEEDDQFDAVQFKENKGQNLFHKLKNMRKKGENPFEDIQMSEKDPLT